MRIASAIFLTVSSPASLDPPVTGSSLPRSLENPTFFHSLGSYGPGGVRRVVSPIEEEPVQASTGQCPWRESFLQPRPAFSPPPRETPCCVSAPGAPCPEVVCPTYQPQFPQATCFSRFSSLSLGPLETSNPILPSTCIGREGGRKEVTGGHIM